YPGLRRGLLLDPDQPMAIQTGLFLPLLARDAVHPPVGRFDRVDVDRWHRSGREVAAWTVDDPVVADQLREWGVDSCITNRPGDLRAALARGAGRPSSRSSAAARAAPRSPSACRGRAPGPRQPDGGGG